MSSCHAEKTIGSLPRTLVMDVTMTHDRYGRTTQCTNGALTHRVSSTGAPQPDGALNKADRIKMRHYRQIYADRSDPIVFLPVVVSTSGRVYEDFTRLLFLTRIGKLVFWPENYLRNLSSFVSCELHASLILKDL
jgi:hypothetical protein